MAEATNRAIPRILFVVGAYYPEFSAGGLQSRLVAQCLVGRAEVRVITTATSVGLKEHDTVDGVPVSRIPIGRGGWSRARSAVRLVAELHALLPRVDVVHIQGFSAKNILISAMAKLYQRPVLLHLQTAKHDEPAAVKAQGPLAWWAFRSADLYLSVSPGLTKPCLDAGMAAERFRETPNGVDASRFSPASQADRNALRARLNLPVNRPMILFVGVISPDKQPHVLLDAFLQLQQQPELASTLVIVGASDPALFELGGGLINQLRAIVAASGFADRVVFVPPTSQIQDYFRASDIYAMPSLREGLPIALLEAMSCGLPCVASRLPGSTDVLIEDGANGLLVPSRNVKALAEGLASLIADPAHAAHIGAAARRTVEQRYTAKRVADMWLDAYLEVLAS